MHELNSYCFLIMPPLYIPFCNGHSHYIARGPGIYIYLVVIGAMTVMTFKVNNIPVGQATY